MKYFKVNITETIMRYVWIKADDPFDAADKAEKRYSCPAADGETIDVEFDVNVTAERPRDKWDAPYE